MSTEAAEKRRPEATVAVGVFLALLAFTVVLVAASIPAGFYAVFSGGLASTGQFQTYVCPGQSTAAFAVSTPICPYFWIGPFAADLPPVVTAGGAFAAVSLVYVALLLYGALQQRRPWRAAVDSFRGGFAAVGSSPFLVMVVSVGFLTFTASMIDYIVTAAGVPVGSISGDPLAVFVGVTYAPLVEELGFRVVLIGLVAFVLSLGRPLRDALGALWRPSKATEGLSGRSGTSLTVWGATAVSAVVFGATHVAYGGWPIGKLPEAAFGGLVLGYVYVKYGFHVAVITHWGIDYFGSAFSFYGQAAYGIPWNSATNEYVGQYLVDFDLLFLFGLACFLVVTYLGVVRLTRKAPGDSERFIPQASEGPAQR